MRSAQASGPSDLTASASAAPPVARSTAHEATARATWNGSMWPAASGKRSLEMPLTYWASPSVPRWTLLTPARSKRRPIWATACSQKSPGASPTQPRRTGSTRRALPPPRSLPA